MEERSRVVPRDQGDLPRCALDEVLIVRDDRRDLAIEPLLAPGGGHPGARPLTRPCEGIEEEEPDMVTRRLVGHLPDPDIGMVDGHILGGSELEIEELARDPEHPLSELLELEVGLHLVLVELVPLAPDLLGVVEVVPGLDRDLLAPRCLGLSIGYRLHIGDLLADSLDRWTPDRFEELHGILGRLRHRRLEPPMRMGLITEELRALSSQL